MPQTDSNVNLNQQLGVSQTGPISSSLQPGLLKYALLCPKGTIIPAASLTDPTTIATYLKGVLQNNVYSSQWFSIGPLSEYKDATEADSVWKTAPYNIVVYQYPHNYSFNALVTLENFVEMTGLSNWGGDYYFIDWKGQIWGAADPTGLGGLASFDNQQFFVGNRKPMTDKTGEMYPVMFQFGSVADTNAKFKLVAANYTQNPPGLQNAIITDVSSVIGTALGGAYVSTTDQVIIIKGGQDSIDLVKNYGAQIVANLTVLVGTDLNTAGALTIASATTGLITPATQGYWYIVVRYSGAVTSTHKAQLALAAPSVILPLIANFNYVTAIPQPGVNGANAGVKTFA